MSIPIINLSSFFDGKEKLKKDIAYKRDIACRDIGFFGITGHGVDEKVMSKARRVSEQFFNLTIQPSSKILTSTTLLHFEHFSDTISPHFLQLYVFCSILLNWKIIKKFQEL